MLTVLGAAVGCAGDDAAPATTVALTAPSTAPPTAPAATSPPATVTTASPTTSTSVVETTVTSGPAVQPVGFQLAPAEITLADGEVCKLCLWVAETIAQRQRGLMGVTDLAGGDGMVFVYDSPASGQFWMRGTPMSLSIAFFAADGRFVSATDMEPCLTGPPSACPRYSAEGPYVAAIEVPTGRFAELGIGPGSRLVLHAGDGCAG